MKRFAQIVVRSLTFLTAMSFCIGFAGTVEAKGPVSWITPERLRCEYLVDPIGLDERAPRLSWFVTSDKRGQKQAEKRI